MAIEIQIGQRESSWNNMIHSHAMADNSGVERILDNDRLWFDNSDFV